MSVCINPSVCRMAAFADGLAPMMVSLPFAFRKAFLRTTLDPDTLPPPPRENLLQRLVGFRTQAEQDTQSISQSPRHLHKFLLPSPTPQCMSLPWAELPLLLCMCLLLLGVFSLLFLSEVFAHPTHTHFCLRHLHTSLRHTVCTSDSQMFFFQGLCPHCQAQSWRSHHDHRPFLSW